MPAGRKRLVIDELVERLPGSPVAEERLRVILANIAGQIGEGARRGVPESTLTRTRGALGSPHDKSHTII